ncbi:hypothetical protein Tco_0824693 [Tanacetum coccineum]|uniref:Uncharacterized protein n=1 Tax=Tanacetum coccineum TaxID=301880 RepID=A0ABQ5AR55_9ASTR
MAKALNIPLVYLNSCDSPPSMGEGDSDDSELEGVGRRGLFPFGMILKTLFRERNHHVIHKIEIIRESMRMSNANMFKEASEKHSIRNCHIGTLGHTYHSLGNVVGKIKAFQL